MTALKRVTEKHPVLVYLVLCFAISWSVWFALPLVAGGQWALMKVMIGIGMGPGLSAVLLDRVRGNAGPITGRWWLHFAIIFMAVTALALSSLLTGDARLSSELAAAHPIGLTPVSLTGTFIAAAVCGFIFASAAASRSHTLNSILPRAVPIRWLLIALLLPAALLLLSLAIARVTGDEMPESVRGGLPAAKWMWFAARAALFTLLAVAVGEEPGWRGWMLPELQKRFSPLNSSLIVGAVWGFWHFPLFLNGFYPGGAESIVEYLFIGPLIALLVTWVYNRSGGVLLTALLLHTAINNSQRVIPTATMFPVLLTVLIVALVFTERMWRRRTASPAVAMVVMLQPQS